MNKTELENVIASLRVAVDAGDLGALGNGVAALERLLTESDGHILKMPPLYMDQKDALRFVMSHDGFFHSAWDIGDGVVVVVEYVPVNYPALSLATFESIAAYEQSVKDIPWIVDGDNEDDEEEDGALAGDLATPEFLEELQKMT